MFRRKLAKRPCEFALSCQIRQEQHLRVSWSCVYSYWCLNHWITAARNEMSVIASMQYHAEKSPAHRHKPLATVGPTQEAMASAEGNKVKETPAGFQNAHALRMEILCLLNFFPLLFFFSCEAQQSKKQPQTFTKNTDIYTERRYFYQETVCGHTNCWGVNGRGGGEKKRISWGRGTVYKENKRRKL